MELVYIKNEKLLCITLVLLAGCIRATDEVKAKSKANLGVVSAAQEKVCPACKPAFVPVVQSAQELDVEINKGGIDIVAGIEQGTNVAAEVAPVVASLPFPWAPVVGAGMLTATAIALALAHGLKKKPIA